MTIRRFMPRPSNITTAVQWTGSNLSEIEEYLLDQEYDAQWISENVSVNNNVLTIENYGYSSPTIAQPDQWLSGGQVFDEESHSANYQEVVGVGPFVYVLDDEGA